MIEVVEPGLLTTVQDSGRPGLGRLGVPAGGAADSWAFATANVLAGNAPGAAALEVTAAGPRLRALGPVTVAIAGADFGASAAGRPLAPGGPAVTLAAGDELSLPGPPATGLRAYVAIRGGIDVPVVLGSRSTCLAAAFGGLEGRPLRAGDRLSAGPAPPDEPSQDAWPGEPVAPRRVEAAGRTVLRLIAGPSGLEALAGSWIVATSSDRMGVRLEPDGGGRAAVVEDTALASHGVVPGTVQLPPDGRPIVLAVDHQPTGGYPVAGVTITADLPVLGQLASGDTVRFEAVDLEVATRALLDQRRQWTEAVRTLRGDAAWRELWQSAGA